MRLVKSILLYAFLGVLSIVALLFAFVELRSLFAGDFRLFNNPFLGGLAYFLRGLYYLLIVTLCVFIVLFRTHHKKYCIILFAVAVSLLIGALLSLMFYDYYISLVIIFVTAILVTIVSIGFFSKKEQQACEVCQK